MVELDCVAVLFDALIESRLAAIWRDAFVLEFWIEILAPADAFVKSFIAISTDWIPPVMFELDEVIFNYSERTVAEATRASEVATFKS